MKINVNNCLLQSYSNRKVEGNVQMFSKILNNKNSKGDQDSLSYYYKLCKEFPDISFRLEDKEEALKNTRSSLTSAN